jgi:bifunctional oligoribonuclease and PAP phosphatase NrnA
VTAGPTPEAPTPEAPISADPICEAPISEAQWAHAAKILQSADEICLACHVRPDADALGSMVALAQALAARPGHPARVVASFGDAPFEIPAILEFLPGLSFLADPAGYPARPQVMVTLDAGSIDRLGLLTASAAAAAELIVLDHHASNTRFGSVNLVDPAAAATAVLVADLISRLEVPLTPGIALGLYAGLVTDTGSFKFASTTPAVHELAARLLATGIDPGIVSRHLYDTAPFAYLPMLAAALDRAVLEPDAAGGLGMVWTTVTRRDRGSLPFDAAEPVIDVIRRTEEAEVAVVLKESDDGSWQVSTRSKSLVDVSAVCAALGGGGHARAAGFSASGGPDEAVAALRRLLARQ